MSDTNQAQKVCIEAFFEDLQSRIDFIEQISKMTRKYVANGSGYEITASSFSEVILLTCCLIDGLGNYHFKESKSHRLNFIKVLKDYGDNPIFSSIHPKQLKRYLEKKKNDKKLSSRLSSDYSKIECFLDNLSNKNIMFNEGDFLKALNSEATLSDETKKELEKQLPNGTCAAIVYDYLRIETVHNLGAVPVSFSEVTFEGDPVKELSFLNLHNALRCIASHLKRIKIESIA